MKISDIVIDESVYPRNGVSAFSVRRLVAALKTGVKFPPLVIEAGTKRLVDGRLRLEAYREEGVDIVRVTEKVYASDGDLFADAVRLNVAHGEALDHYCISNAIIRLTEYGFDREQISQAVRLPPEQIEKITRGFAIDENTGKPLALKGGLGHLRGQTLSADQQALNRHYSGTKATFYARQIRELLEHDMWPNRSANFIHEMDLLVDMWLSLRSPKRTPRGTSEAPEARP
jgi:ParB-like chromosome segregation protein Spo0J